MKVVKITKIKEVRFAAGCFWSVELIFSQTSGVVSTMVGYSGGNLNNPTYEQVCTGSTGHAETVKLLYDPQKISYEALLEVFWNMHDPTQMNRQGIDVGTQYRSVIFYTDSEQKEIAEKSKKLQEKKIGKKIATEIVPAMQFY